MKSVYKVGQKCDTLLAFKFHPLLDALYLEFLFTHVSFSLNCVITTVFRCRRKQVLLYANKLSFRHDH